MSSKLAILIPHYHETEEEIKPLLDSIESQINVRKNDFEVIIGNDGDEVQLSLDFLQQYHFRLQYHIFEHARLAGCRKNLFDISDAEYVMFCDADDRFISDVAFSLILDALNLGIDGLICAFLEEHILKDGRAAYIQRTHDSVFVHGKVWRSAYLRENKIEWDASLHEHQDSAFNVLACLLTQNKKYFDIPIYLWHDNPKSVCRKNGEYHLPNTWAHMIDSYDSLINQLMTRGYGDAAAYYAKYCLYASYFEMSRDIWQQEDVNERKINTYKRINAFYTKYELLIRRCSEEMTKKIIDTTKKITEQKGKLNDMPPFEEWLKTILVLFKGG